MTFRTGSIPIRVVALSRFDPSSLPVNLPTVGTTSRRWVATGVFLLAAIGLAVGIGLIRRSSAHRRRAWRASRWFATAGSFPGSEVVGRVGEELAAYLGAISGRTVGEWTAAEAAGAIEDAALAARVGHLLARAEAVRFGRGDEVSTDPRLADEAAAVFAAIALARGRPRPRSPRGRLFRR